MAVRLFLSYAGEDHALVWLLDRELAQRGIRTFNYLRDGAVGERAFDRIDAELRKSDEMLMILTPQAKRAPFVTTEYGMARQLRIPIYVGLHYLTLDRLRADRKWREYVEQGAFEMNDKLPAYLDELEARHGR